MTGDELFDYPCGFGDEWTGQDHCSEKCPAVEMKRPCPLLPVYRAHIKLRDDMRKLIAEHDAEDDVNLAELTGYPCAIELDATQGTWTQACQDDCSIADTCPARDVYEQAIALRAAVLGDMTPEEAAETYCNVAKLFHDVLWDHKLEAHFNALAAAVAKL